MTVPTYDPDATEICCAHRKEELQDRVIQALDDLLTEFGIVEYDGDLDSIADEVVACSTFGQCRECAEKGDL